MSNAIIFVSNTYRFFITFGRGDIQEFLVELHSIVDFCYPSLSHWLWFFCSIHTTGITEWGREYIAEKLRYCNNWGIASDWKVIGNLSIFNSLRHNLLYVCKFVLGGAFSPLAKRSQLAYFGLCTTVKW